MLHLVPPPLGIAAVPDAPGVSPCHETGLLDAARRLERAKATLAWAESAAKALPGRDRERDVIAACDQVLYARVDFLRLLSRQGLAVQGVSVRCDIDEVIAGLEVGAMGA